MDYKWDYDYDYYTEEEYITETRGQIMDHIWYGIESYGESNAKIKVCSTQEDCGNEATNCCVSIVSTNSFGMTDQFFRCMNKGLIDMNFDETTEMSNGEEISFTMKCLESSSVIIKVGLVVIGSVLI